METKIPVCSECGNTVFSETDGQCLICLSNERKLVTLPSEVTCDSCKSKFNLNENLEVYTSTKLQKEFPVSRLPYFNPVEATFYCGCEGWD